ncbi:hypothetical protein P12x_003149 [Tundrisphaera lichenicola]|uniref:hypothetical protein n=1 Tax=Tundrisphaera lichenicola TaxID=2029860 RepID=UPI003EBDE8D7
MTPRSTSKFILVPACLAGLMALALATGCSSKVPETDTAEVISTKPAGEAPTPSPTDAGTTEDAPKG